MTQLILDDGQADIIAKSSGEIEVCDRRGNLLGRFSRGFTDEDIAIAKRRAASDAPRYTTQQVVEYLESLDGESAHKS